MSDGLQRLHVIADDLDHHHHWHRQQQPPDPQAQVQNSRPANTATWFIDAARPISVGMRSNPSSVVISNDTPATAIVIPMVPN
jgi:hypothetical protein